jgi:aminoglycoside phosphotransferase family enzyme
MERALDVVVRARGFEDNQTILFAHLLENGTIQESEAMELAQRVANLPFMEDDDEE